MEIKTLTLKIDAMKLLLITIVVLSFTSIGAEGLENERSFWMGFQSGINTSFFNSPISEYGDSKSEFEPFVRISALLGVGSIFQFSPITSLITELNINSRGGSYRAENRSVVYLGSSNNEKAYHMRNFRLTYLELPVLINLNLNQLFPSADHKYSLFPKHHYVSFSAGFAPALNIGSSLRVNSFSEGKTISGPLVEIKTHYDIEEFDYAEFLIFNSIIGLAYNIPLVDTSIASFNLRWSQSLNDVYSIKLKDNYNMQTKMSSITMGASIMF